MKVETNGSGGVKNALTAEEIAAADGIIVAADKNVETARFDGKPVIFVPVSDGIHKAEGRRQRRAPLPSTITRAAPRPWRLPPP